METEIKIFISYLHNTKRMSGNTVVSYERDLRKMMQYFQEAHQITRVQDITETSLNSYMLYLEKNHFAASTVSRSVASMRAFFQYLYQEHLIENNPADHLHPPKVEKKMPQILSVEEVDLLLRQPSDRTPKGLRDRAMLELLYATGIRVSELIHLEMSDVNLAMGYINCRDTDSERVIHFGSQAKKGITAIYAYSAERVPEGAGKRSAFYKLFGKTDEQTGILESTETLCTDCRDRERYYAAYSAAFVCCTSDPERSRLKKCAGDAGTFGYIDNADVSEYECV